MSVAVRHRLVTREELGYSRDQIDAMIADAGALLERGEGIDGQEFFAKLERDGFRWRVDPPVNRSIIKESGRKERP